MWSGPEPFVGVRNRLTSCLDLDPESVSGSIFKPDCNSKTVRQFCFVLSFVKCVVGL